MEDDLRAAVRRRQGRAVLVVDESFFVKNLDTKRTKAIRRLREWCGNAYALCGTPAPNSPKDVIEQFNIVDFGITFASVDIPDDKPEAAGVIRRAIEERGLYVRNLKAAVLPDLPRKRFSRVIVPFMPKQAAAYAAAVKDLILNLRGISDEQFDRDITSFLARRSALLQICSHPAAIIPGYDEEPGKVAALDDILADLVERRREKVVLWSFYTYSINELVRRYEKYEPVRYDGTIVDIAVRRNAVRRFQDDDRTMLFIANPAAAGAGLTLHRARFGIYESFSNQAAHYLQSLDRIHRRGQSRDVEYVLLLSDGSIELQEYERLLQKEQAAGDLLGDAVQPRVTRESMLQEFLASARALEVHVAS
jgi:SNF2 family DNA or RNA helicase